MPPCEDAHREYDKHANGHIQIGQLPNWMNVNGKVAWFVFKGPYNELPEGWSEFMKKAHSLSNAKIAGPPGDVYLCDPTDHKGDENNMLTILWAPLKA
jgi:hypothetical protein